MSGVRLIVYDKTCLTTGRGLSIPWFVGAKLYRALGRHDAVYGATSWSDALAWVAGHEASRPIEELQYWGHGKWGRIFIGKDGFDAGGFTTHASALGRIRERLVPDALVWLRTCEAFGADAGIDFAQRLADGLGARVAGHTFIIGVLQSGLRTLAPGMRPTWSAAEGLAEGSPASPRRAHDSALLAPRTVHCLTNEVPAAWWSADGRA